MKTKLPPLTLLASLLLASAVLAASVPTIPWSLIGGGGGPLAGGTFAANTSIGQAVVGRSSGGPYVLLSGYWAGAPQGLPRRTFLPLLTLDGAAD